MPGVYSWEFGGRTGRPAGAGSSGPVLLLHGEGANGGTTITDSSPYAHTPSVVSGVTTSTAQFKYGSSSLVFDSVGGSYVEYAVAPEFAFGTELTLGAWVRASAVDATRRSIYDYRFDGSASGTSFALDHISGAIRFQLGIGGSLFTITGSSGFTADTWQWVEACRFGDSAWLYLDGVSIGSVSGLGSSALNGSTSGSKPRVGRRNDGTQNFGGWMDEVYWDAVCLHPGGTSFTPPMGPF